MVFILECPALTATLVYKLYISNQLFIAFPKTADLVHCRQHTTTYIKEKSINQIQFQSKMSKCFFKYLTSATIYVALKFYVNLRHITNAFEFFFFFFFTGVNRCQNKSFHSPESLLHPVVCPVLFLELLLRPDYLNLTFINWFDSKTNDMHSRTAFCLFYKMHNCWELWAFSGLSLNVKHCHVCSCSEA